MQKNCFLLFRSPGTGLYSNLEKYDLPNPTAIFDIRYEKLYTSENAFF
jgi:hypothetical protein